LPHAGVEVCDDDPDLNVTIIPSSKLG